MIYFLQVRSLGKDIRIVITEEEFSEISLARDTLTNFFSLTENYRVVIESYRSVEKAKHDAELDRILYNRLGYDGFSAVRVTLNSPIVGYLASARYFLDSTDKILPEILSEPQVESFNKFRNNIYDSNCEYRFIEALRNYVQHRELPVHNVTYHNYVEDSDNIEKSDKVTTLSLHANHEMLLQDKKFKKAALKGMPEVIDIIYCIRFHMEGIWKLHDYFTKSHSDIADKSRSIVSNTIDRLKKESDNSSFVFHAVAALSETEQIAKIPLLLGWDDVRRAELKRIGNLNSLHKRYITGKIKKA